MSEKRRVERLNIELPATFKLSGSQEEVFKATVLDLSAIGICLVTNEEMEVGRDLQIQVQLPTDEGPLVINSKVIWVKEVLNEEQQIREFRVGIKIKDRVQIDEKKFIHYYSDQFISKHKK